MRGEARQGQGNKFHLIGKERLGTAWCGVARQGKESSRHAMALNSAGYIDSTTMPTESLTKIVESALAVRKGDRQKQFDPFPPKLRLAVGESAEVLITKV